MNYSKLKIAYAPVDGSLVHPGDRRRFLYFANKRNLTVEPADPAKSYDVVVVAQGGGDLSSWSRYDKGKIIFDFVDSYLAVDKHELKGKMRGLAKYITRQSRYLQLDYTKALAAMLAKADAVICATAAQHRDIEPYNPNIHIILDYTGFLATKEKTDYSLSGETFHFVWEGLPENIGFFLNISDVLRTIRKRHKTCMHLVTDLNYYLFMRRFFNKSTVAEVKKNIVGLFDHIYLYEWNEYMMPAIVRRCDLALIPVDRFTPMEFARPANKLLLFWQMGMPALVSATPEYVRVNNEAGIDMSCADDKEWLQKLEYYMDNKSAREKSGARAREYVRENFTEDKWLGLWDEAFSSVLS